MAADFPKIRNGVDRKKAQEIIKKFIATQNPVRVLALKGSWGVGKTHLVKSILSKENKDYHYASVFGVSTVEELRIQLWSNLKVLNDGQIRKNNKFYPGQIRRFFLRKDGSEDLEKMIEAIPVIGSVGGALTSSALRLASHVIINNALKGKLICIDDLERKSRKLPLDELLGFIENLAEELGCKVVILLNEERILEFDEDRDNLKSYREKVIDFEIELSPTVFENFQIAFGDSDPDENLILNYFTKNQIQANNIRVLSKLKYFLDELRPKIEGFLPLVRKEIIENVIFIVLAKLDRSFPVKLDELLGLGSWQEVLKSGDKKGQDLYLNALKWGFLESGISREVIQLIETSVCDMNAFIFAAQEMNEREVGKAIRERFIETCRPFWESFASSEQELRDNIIQFLDDLNLSLSANEIGQIEEVARSIELDVSEYKKVWINNRIKGASSIQALESLRSIASEYPELMAELESRSDNLRNGLSITQVLLNSLKSRSWSPEDADYLNACTVEEYKTWLQERHEDKMAMLEQALKIGDAKNIREAIKELAATNKLNAFRAKRLLGIDVEGTESIDTNEKSSGKCT